MIRIFVLILASVSGMTITTRAGAACTDAQAASFTRVPVALDAWQARSGIAIAAQFRQEIARAFCTSASILVRQGRTRSDVDAATAPALSAYLDAYAGVEEAQTVDAALRTQLGASGMARPVVRSYGKLELIQVHPLDAFRLGEVALPLAPRVLAPVGTANYFGTKGGVRQCSGSVTIVAGASARVRC